MIDPVPQTNEASAVADTADAAALSPSVVALAMLIPGLQKVNAVLRQKMRWLALAVVLDICLSIGLGLVAYKAWHADHQASAAHSSTVLACVQNNTVRADARQFWNFLFTELVPALQPAESARLFSQSEELDNLMNTTYAPSFCG
jgi:hypothetical protein